MQKDGTGRFSANKPRAELCSLCLSWIYLCMHMCKPVQTGMLMYIFSCSVDTVMHKDKPLYSKSELACDSQLHQKQQPVLFTAPLPTRGSWQSSGQL